MNRKPAYKARPDREEFFGLMTCAVFFLSGIAVGTFSASSLDEAGVLALQNSMVEHIDQIIAGTHIPLDFWGTLWVTGRVHLLVLFLGFSLLGVLCLPVVAGARGFYLSFSIAAFIRVFGTGGWPLAFALFGAGALITVPCFFLLASQAFSASVRLGKSAVGMGQIRAGALYGQVYLVRAGVCAGGILGAVFLELYVTPLLVIWASSFL